MSNQTVVHTPVGAVNDEPHVYLNPGSNSGPFAVVTFSPSMWMYLHDAAHARAIAAAFTQAADLLKHAAVQPAEASAGTQS